MGAYASSLTERISTAITAEPATPAATAEPPTPASEPSAAPAPATPSSDSAAPPESTQGKPAEAAGAAAPASEVEEDEFEFPDERPAEGAPEEKAAPKPEDDESKPWAKMLPKEVESQFLKTARGRRMLQSFKVAQELEKPADMGGLGFVPTVDQVKEYAQAASDLRTMAHEFNSGDPASAANFINNWFLNPNQSGARAVAQQFIPAIADAAKAGDQHASEVYREIAIPAVKNYIEELYGRAAEMPDEQSRVLWFNIARHVETDLTGNAREVPEALWKEGRKENAPDAKVTEIDTKIRRIDEFEQRQRQQAEQNFGNAMNTAIGKFLMDDITAALGPIKGTTTERAYNALAKQFHDEITSRVWQNPAAMRNFEIAKAEAKRNPSMANIQNAAKAWQAVARPIIKQLRADYIKDATAAKVAESNQRHEVLSEASQKRGTASVAQSSEKDLGEGSAKRQPGETHEEFMLRRTRAALSMVG